MRHIAKNYNTPFGKAYSNEQEQIIFVDSLPNNVDAKNFMLAFTKDHEEQIVADNDVQVQQIIPAAFKNAEMLMYEGVPLQKASYDCGWWAVYNAVMIVLEGNLEFLNQFKGPSRESAYALRYLLGDLAQQEVIVNSENNTSTQLINVALDEYWKFKTLPSQNENDKKKNKESIRHRKLITNIIAVTAISFGAFLAFAGSVFSSQGLSLGLLIPGLVITGLGIVPRLLVELYSTLEIANKEKDSKKMLNEQINKLTLDINLKNQLVATYRLNERNKGKWVNLAVKGTAMLFTYITALAISILLITKKNTKDKDKQMDYLTWRFILTGLSALTTFVFTLFSLILENTAQKRQEKLDTEIEKLNAKLEVAQIETIISSSQRAILQQLRIKPEQAGFMLKIADQDRAQLDEDRGKTDQILNTAPPSTSKMTDTGKNKDNKSDVEHGHTTVTKKGL